MINTVEYIYYTRINRLAMALTPWHLHTGLSRWSRQDIDRCFKDIDAVILDHRYATDDLTIAEMQAL